MGGFIALYVTACLNLGNPGSCVTEFVTDSTQSQITMTECLGVEGLYSAKEFVEKHPVYHTWQFKAWSCQIGNKPGTGKGRTGELDGIRYLLTTLGKRALPDLWDVRSVLAD